MLRFFRTNSSNNFFFLILYAAVLHLHSWFHPLTIGEFEGVSPLAKDVFGWLYHWMPADGPLSRLLALALVLIQAMHFAKTVQEFKIISPVNWLVALFYVLFASFLPAFQYFSPELLAITLLLIAFRILFSTYYMEQTAGSSLLDVGLLTGMIALLHVPYSLLLLAALLSLLIIRPLRIRELVVVVVGFGVPWFLTAIGYMMLDRLPDFTDGLRFLPSEFFLFKLSLTSGQIVLVSMALLLLLASIAHGQLRMATSLIHSRKFQQMVLIILLVGVLSQLLLNAVRLEPFMIFVAPLSFFTAYLVHHLAWHRTVEGLHAVVFLLVLTSQFLLR